MNTNRLSEDDALAFGRRLDAFAAELAPGERTLLITILHDAEAAQHDAADHRTPGDIAMAIHRTYLSPRISLNPQPIPKQGV